MELRFKRAKSLFDLKCSEGLDLISDVTKWPVCKRYLGKQVAKCVNECKSQASEAKKAVQGITKTKKKRFQVATGSAGEPDELDSGDGWSSDEFDTGDEDDDDEKDYSNTITEVGFSVSDFGSDNSSANGPESVASSESSGQYNDVTLDIRSSMPGRTAVWNLKGPSSGRELDTASPETRVVLKSMSRLQTEGDSSPEPSPNPKPAGKSPKSKAPTPSPVSAEKLTPKSNNTSGGGNVVQRRFASKLQRPHSLPPAPPPSRVSLEPETEPLVEEKSWEYEIPNSGIPVHQRPSSPTSVLPAVGAPIPPLRHRTHSALANGDSPKAAQSNRRSLQETIPQEQHSHRGTYENVDKPEEGNYEIVDDDRPAVQSQERRVSTPPGPKPFLPPRKPAPLPPHLLQVQSAQKRPQEKDHPTEMESPSSPETMSQSSVGSDSRNSMNLLINEFRSKLNQQLSGSNGHISTDRADAVLPTLKHSPQKVKEPGTSGSVECAEGDLAPPPPLPLSRPPDVVSEPPETEDSGSMSDRPLPPVPSSQRKKMEDLSQLPYYVNVERDEAEKKLLCLGQDDAYLVRPSRRGGSDNPHTLTLIHKGRPFHLNIRLRPDGLYALGRKKEQEVVFGSISSLVSHHQQYPIYLSMQGATVGTSLLKRHP